MVGKLRERSGADLVEAFDSRRKISRALPGEHLELRYERSEILSPTFSSVLSRNFVHRVRKRALLLQCVYKLMSQQITNNQPMFCKKKTGEEINIYNQSTITRLYVFRVANLGSCRSRHKNRETKSPKAQESAESDRETRNLPVSSH